MTPETKKRMDHLLFMQRLKIGLIAAAVIASILGIMVFVGYEQTIHTDKVTSTAILDGTIIDAKRGVSRSAGFKLTVKLDDGKIVESVSMLPAIPYKGERLTVRQIVHQSGRVNYQAIRLDISH